MAYRLTYQAQVAWIGPGLGPIMNSATQPVVTGVGGNGNAQIKDFFNTVGGQNSNTFVAADITALLAAMSADLSAQMNAAAALAQVQAFATGGG